MNQASRAFDALVQEFYEAWFRFHPERALQAGISGYEGRLPAVDDDDFGALGSLLESLLVGLQELDFHALDDDRQLDLQVLFGAAQAEHQCLLERDWRHRDPGGFLPLRTLRELLLHPRVELGGVLGPFLDSVPEFLRHARSQLRTVPELVSRFWCEAAAEEARSGLGCLEGLRISGALRRLSRNPGPLRARVDEAAEAIASFASDLEHEVAPHAAGEVAAGRGLYAFLLRQRFFVAAEPEALRGLVERSLAEGEETQAGGALEEPARGSAPPDPARVLEQLRDYWQRVHRFLEQRRLAEIPLRAQLRVVGAPEFLSPAASFPYYVPPPMGDPDLIGTVYVDAEQVAASSAATEQARSAGLRFGWAGRHLQAVCAAGSAAAGTLVRRLNPCPGFVGGWPLYAERMLLDHGYDDSPGARRAMLAERRRCASLAALEVDLHLGRLSIEQAVERTAGLPGGEAGRMRRDLLELTRDPGRAMAQFVGWRMIEALSEHLAAHDPGHAPDGFHHRLLDAGPAALPLVIRGSFGQSAWEAVNERLGL